MPTRSHISRFASALNALTFSPPVAYVYNPLDYARATAADFHRRYAIGTGKMLLLGMNPGPWGMAQTGVPFGEVNMVRDWLGIKGKITKPTREHPKRPVMGLDCHRSEVSGRRVWGWARDTFGTPDRFFEHFFVANYCPLMFLDADARNITPDKLQAKERTALETLCDRALINLVNQLQPRRIIGIGKYAESRARAAIANTCAVCHCSVSSADDPPRTISTSANQSPLRKQRTSSSNLRKQVTNQNRDRKGAATQSEQVETIQTIPISSIPHPSPANPAANRGWAKMIDEQLLPLLPANFVSTA